MLGSDSGQRPWAPPCGIPVCNCFVGRVFMIPLILIGYQPEEMNGSLSIFVAAMTPLVVP